MKPAVPHYILEAKIQDESVRFKWDEWEDEEAEGIVDEELQARLAGISQRANVAFTLASAEWIFHRFAIIMDDPFPLQYAEAAWAQIIDILYSYRWQFENEEWVGPIKGPVMRAIMLVVYSIDEMASDRDPALCSATMSKLAEHVITDPSPYQAWRESALRRLESLYPLDRDEKLGEVVPREALDPDYDFKIEQTEMLINRFLGGLDPTDNEMLNTPQDMRAQGFDGKPYIFDIEADRKKRFEW